MLVSDSHTSEDSAAATIKGMLRARLGKQWCVGDRLPPVKELARQLGTGQSNTQVAVRELARDGLLTSRRRQGTFVRKVPASTRAESFAGALTGREILLYGSSPLKLHIRRMMDSFVAEVEPAGATVRQLTMSDQGVAEFDPDADAIVVFNPSSSVPIQCRPKQLLGIVSSTRFVSAANHERYDMVGIDELHGGLLAGKMLRESGCRRPCFVGRSLASDDTRFDAISSSRLHGFEEGWGEHLPSDCLIKAGGYNSLAGSVAFRSFLEMEPRPDGIFAASDDIAFGLLVAAGAHHLTPPNDFQIVGFDGQDGTAVIGDMLLSTVVLPFEQLGRRAAQMLLHRFNDPDRPVDRLLLECVPRQGRTTYLPRQTRRHIPSEGA